MPSALQCGSRVRDHQLQINNKKTCHKSFAMPLITHRWVVWMGKNAMLNMDALSQEAPPSEWKSRFYRAALLSVYSHLSCLVRLNQTQVCLPPWCGSFGQVWIQQIALGCTTNNRTETQMKRWSRSTSKQTLVRTLLMTLSTRVVLFKVSGSLAKWAVWKRTAPKKKKKKK